MGKHYDVDEEFAAVQNADIDEIEVEKPTLITYIVDKSASMSPYESDMGTALDAVKETINGSKEADEMRVSVIQFADKVSTSGYQEIENIDVQYRADGCSTKLYDANVNAQKALYAGDGSGYMEKLYANGNRPKAVIFIFTDGYDNSSKCSKHDARMAIEFLQKNEIPVGFIEFGNEAHGISKEVADMAQIRAFIPMCGKSESLNASVAAGIVMYDVVKQNIAK